MGNYTTAAGSVLAISAGAPATYDAAGFAALTWTVIGGIDKIGTVGAEVEEVTFQPLSGDKDKLKGPADHGALLPSMAVDESDAGQTLVRAAAVPTNNAKYSFKVILPSGAIRYSRGRVFGFPENVDSASSVFMAAPKIGLTDKVIPVAAP